jgi:hypothetical protein
MNGDNSTEDGARWKSQVFSPLVNTFIAEITQLGGEAELVRTFDLFRKEFEAALQQIRDRLMINAMDRGLET